MTNRTPQPEAIRRERAESPKMCERDLATRLGISEAQLVAAHVGEGARRIEPRVNELIEGMAALGEVMALTRNDGAVHEKIGVYDRPVAGTAGDLRERWSRMTDVHQFFGMLRTLDLGRRQAVRLVGEDYAWQLDAAAVPVMLERAVETQVPIMCFVGNEGCIQIHSGPVANIRPMGPWLNVLDETFHLHLRLDHIAEAWAVRKPTKDGHVTSIEAFDADGTMIIQFFGKRQEGVAERDMWRAIVEALPRLPRRSAA